MQPTDERDIRHAIYHTGLQEHAQKALDRVLEDRARFQNALIQIEQLDYKNAATNGAAYDAVKIACTALH